MLVFIAHFYTGAYLSSIGSERWPPVVNSRLSFDTKRNFSEGKFYQSFVQFAGGFFYWDEMLKGKISLGEITSPLE